MIGISQLAGAYALALMGTTHAPTTEAARADATLPSLWAGHQVALGKREIPVKGEVETRMDSFVLARLVRQGNLVELHQTACHVRFSKVAGVTVLMRADALPETRMVFASDADDGTLLEGRSVVAWSAEDLDDDGHPGVTVRVQAPVCAGELYVSNRSRTKATARLTPTRLEGRAKVHVRQQILGAEGACLSAVAKDTDEHQSGPFAYVPVPEGTTCETLLLEGWPVIAD